MEKWELEEELEEGILNNDPYYTTAIEHFAKAYKKVYNIKLSLDSAQSKFVNYVKIDDEKMKVSLEDENEGVYNFIYKFDGSKWVFKDEYYDEF